MKKKVALLILLATMGFNNTLFPQPVKLYKASELNLLMQLIPKDSMLFLERLAALYFHRKLNAYRKSQNLDTLIWDDILWLSCRNHSIYMIQNKALTHSEDEGNTYFSGENPGARLTYVQDKERKLNWCGENALYNYSGSGNYIAQTAMQVAEASLRQWKNSPGHNDNMLSQSPTSHAVAFVFEDNLVYATSIFGYSQNYFWASQEPSPKPDPDHHHASNPDDKTLSKSGMESTKTVKLNLNRERKNIENDVMEQMAEISGNIGLKNNRVLGISAKKHTEYMAYNNILTYKEKRNSKSFYGKNLAQRIARAEGEKLWFLKHKTDVNEYICMIETEEPQYHQDSIYAGLMEKLVHENQLSIEKIKEVGFSARITRNKKKLKIYAVLLIRIKE